MKKIMFNDRFGLTQAVLDGRKTMTRRICKDQSWSKSDILAFNYDRLTLMTPPNYLIGEVVAIAQSYETLANSGYLDKMMDGLLSMKKEYAGAGYKNKMFVKADLMPHHIKITNIRVDYLQNINNYNCLREGIYIDKEGGQSIGYPLAVPFYYTFRGAINRDGKQLHWSTPKDAYLHTMTS